MKKLLFCIFLGPICLLANSVTIYNDSPFNLTATIIAATGEAKGSVTVSPQNQATWQDNYYTAFDASQTPYTVIFTCPEGEEFGVASYVAAGATVTALSSSGRHYCKPNKQQNQQGQNTFQEYQPSSPFSGQGSSQNQQEENSDDRFYPTSSMQKQQSNQEISKQE